MTYENFLLDLYSCYIPDVKELHSPCSHDKCGVHVYVYGKGVHPSIQQDCFVLGNYHEHSLISGILFTPHGVPQYCGRFDNYLPDGEGVQYRPSLIFSSAQQHREAERNSLAPLSELGVYRKGTFQRGYFIRGQVYLRNGDLLDGDFATASSFTGRHLNRSGHILYDGEMRFDYGASRVVRDGEGVYQQNEATVEATYRDGRMHGLVNVVKPGAVWFAQATFGLGTILEGWYYVNKHGTRFYHGRLGEDGKPEGYGLMISPNDDQFCGNFQGGNLHGKGYARWAHAGICHRGLWQNGFQHGPGTETVERRYTKEIFCERDKTIYDGRWERGKKHGGFTLTKDGQVFQEDWIHGKLHSSSKVIPTSQRKAPYRLWLNKL